MKFKKFSDISKKSPNEIERLINLKLDKTKGGDNLPKDSTKELISFSSTEQTPKQSDEVVESNTFDKIGKVAKFQNNTKVSKAYNFLENVKIPKSAIWYIMVEKQDDELHMVKYDFKKGVDLSKFVNELKEFYIEQFKNHEDLVEKISNIEVDGDDKYSMIKNIPQIKLKDRKMISIITNDLIKLLSK